MSASSNLMCIILRKVNHHWLLWFLSALVVNGAVAGNPDAKRLYDDLLSNYNKLVRPVVNTSDVLRVCIKLKLSQLIDVVRRISFYTFFMLIYVNDDEECFSFIHLFIQPQNFINTTQYTKWKNAWNFSIQTKNAEIEMFVLFN